MRFMFFVWWLLSGCIETYASQEGEGADMSVPSPQGDVLLDPECVSGDYDYIVRALWPRTPKSPIVEVNLHGDDLIDIPVFGYQVHACTSFMLKGAGVWFTPADGFDEEEGDPRDPTGIIIGEEDGWWVHRFYDFRLRVGGELVAEQSELIEFTVADSNGSTMWNELEYPMNPGDMLEFEFSMSVREDNPPAEPHHFVAEYFATTEGAPTPNPQGRFSPWPLEITYPALIQLIP